jgi:hypothetical protein
MTDAYAEHVRDKLRALIASVRTGKRTDGLSEADVRAYWVYLEGSHVGSPAMEANYVRTREDLTRVVKKIRRALREMRELEHAGGKG